VSAAEAFDWIPLPTDLTTAELTFEGRTYVVLSYPTGGSGIERAISPAELGVARCVAAGASNAEIAAVRGTSVRTVANQISSILRKTGLSSRCDLARRWNGCGE
jgi:DNA-binding NarL/FixJ family response regulator